MSTQAQPYAIYSQANGILLWIGRAAGVDLALGQMQQEIGYAPKGTVFFVAKITEAQFSALEDNSSALDQVKLDGDRYTIELDQ